jgi:AAA domain
VAADSVLIPMQCEYYALEGLSALLSTVEQIRDAANPGLSIEGVLRTMFDPRNNLANEVSAQLIAHFASKVFRTVIPRNIRLAEAPSFGTPVLFHDKESRGALAYLSLAGEMIRREELAGLKSAADAEAAAAHGQDAPPADDPAAPSHLEAQSAPAGPGESGAGTLAEQPETTDVAAAPESESAAPEETTAEPAPIEAASVEPQPESPPQSSDEPAPAAPQEAAEATPESPPAQAQAAFPEGEPGTVEPIAAAEPQGASEAAASEPSGQDEAHAEPAAVHANGEGSSAEGVPATEENAITHAQSVGVHDSTSDSSGNGTTHHEPESEIEAAGSSGAAEEAAHGDAPR